VAMDGAGIHDRAYACSPHQRDISVANLAEIPVEATFSDISRTSTSGGVAHMDIDYDEGEGSDRQVSRWVRRAQAVVRLPVGRRDETQGFGAGRPLRGAARRRQADDTPGAHRR